MPTGEIEGHSDPCARLVTDHPATDALNNAAYLVAKCRGHGQLKTNPAPIAIPQMPVSTADARGCYSDERIIFADLWDRNIMDDKGFAEILYT